jgi:hypothetical protein
MAYRISLGGFEQEAQAMVACGYQRKRKGAECMPKRNKKVPPPANPGIPVSRIVELPSKTPVSGVVKRICRSEAMRTCNACKGSLICEAFGRGVHGVRRVFQCNMCGKYVLHLSREAEKITELDIHPACGDVIPKSRQDFFWRCYCLACRERIHARGQVITPDGIVDSIRRK